MRAEQQKQPHLPLLCTVAALVFHATCAGPALCQNSSDSLNDLPSELSGGESTAPRSLGKLMGDKEVQGCARKCVATCIRGGGGAPGLGPLSQRRELVVFKDGYRSRQYCLSECIQVCAAALSAKK
ncbi:g10671 [Coccomyxa viridis]|uniref:G10671 protein n=1 Tax=Coccomyxa viridis TaxID=1274662 RepID=A0ABP1GAR9_9CHLO